MSNPGWYPDPGGAPGQYRYWDGSTWSSTTAARPDGSGGPTPGSPTPPPKRRTKLIIGIAAALVVIIVGTVVAVRFFPSTEIIDQDPVPSSTAVDTPPTPPPTVTVVPTPPPTTEPSQSPGSPGPSETPSAANCPAGNPVFRQDHPSDGRVHGGGLSFPKLSGGYGPTKSQSAFTWAYDMDGQEKQIVEGWNSLYAVGAVATFDGFEEPKAASQLVLKCTLTSPTFYQSIISQKPLSSKAITVDGHRGWSLRTEIRIDNPQVQIAGDILEIIVVDTGSPESLAMFWACIPIDEPGDLKQLNSTVKNLRTEE